MAEPIKLSLDEIQKSFAEVVKTTIDPLKAEIAELKAKGQSTAELEAKIKNLEDDAAKKAMSRADAWDAYAKGLIDNRTKGPEPSVSEQVGQFIVAGAMALNETKQNTLINYDKAYEIAKKAFPNSKGLHEVMKKDLEAGVPASGGYTIPQIFAPDYVKALYAATLLDKLGVTRVPMVNGNYRMSRMDTSTTVSWVGEIPSTTATQPAFGDINMQAKKLSAMTLISNSLLRYNAVGLDSWVSQDLSTKAKIALDTAALYGTGTLYQPKGLSVTTGVQTAGSSSTALALTTPIDMVALLEQANVPMINPAWVLSPKMKSWLLGKAFSTGPFAWAAEMNNAKTLNSYPFYTSTTSSYTDTSTDYADLWVGDWSEFLWGVGYDISIEISREGTYVSSGGTTYSAFQRDETIVRLITEHDFDTKHPNSFVYGIYSVS